MIDRFADADPGNNNQHANEDDPADSADLSGWSPPKGQVRAMKAHRRC